MRKNHIILIAVFLFVFVIIFNKTRKTADTAQQLSYEVQKGTLDIHVYATGNLEAELSTKVNAPSSIFERQLQIWEITITDMVEEGTSVDSGQYIASLDQNMIQEKLVAEEEELELAYNNLEDARLDSNLTLNNARDAIITAEETLEEKILILAESKYESPATIQKSEMDKDKAIRGLAQKKQSYELERRKSATKVKQKELDYDRKLMKTQSLSKVLEDVIILAPQRGMVIYHTERNETRSIGSTVSSYSPTIATLPDLSTMISVAYVNEIDISHVKENQEVELSVDAFSDKLLKGKVISVANIGKTVAGSDAKVFEVVIKVLSQDQDLRPAMTTNNTIHTNSYEDVVIVPSETLFSNDSLTYVYITGRNNYKQIVKVGDQNDNYTIIENGLSEGEHILWVEPIDAAELETKGWDIYQMIKDEKMEAEKKAKEEAEKMKREKSKYKKNKGNKQSSGGMIIRRF